MSPAQLREHAPSIPHAGGAFPESPVTGRALPLRAQLKDSPEDLASLHLRAPLQQHNEAPDSQPASLSHIQDQNLGSRSTRPFRTKHI